LIPAQESKVIRNFSPQERAIISNYQSRERLKIFKGDVKLKKSSVVGYAGKTADKATLDYQIEKLIKSDIDSSRGPEISGDSQSRLDLNKNKLIVKNNLSFRKNSLINHTS